jgi:urease accessory protein
VRARARIVAEADGTGGSRLTVLHGEPPLLPRRTGDRTGPAEVHLVGGAAGPLRGDDLLIEVEVGPGARLCVRTVAATIVLGGPPGRRSQTTVRATVAAGGELVWLPEPVVATAGCDHLSRSTVELAAGARLTWREELICGRTGEEPGDLRLVTAVRLDGRPLSTQELTVGPRAPGWAGPAVLGGHRAAGTVLIVDPAWADGRTGTGTGAADRTGIGTGAGPGAGTAEGSLLALAGPAVLASAVAPDAHQLRRRLDRLMDHGCGHGPATANSSP